MVSSTLTPIFKHIRYIPYTGGNAPKMKEYFTGTSKGVAPQSILVLLLVTVSLGAIAYSATQVNNLLTLIVDNLFWFLFGVVMIGASGVFISQSIKDKLDTNQTFLGVAILLIMMIGIPIAGLTIDTVTSSYQAEVEVQVGQHFAGVGNPELESLQVNNVEETGLRIFSLVDQQQACLGFCDEWEVDIVMSCDGDKIGEYTVAGVGSETTSRTIGGLPTDAQCEVQATPGTGVDGGTKTASFITR